jgi:hypothetical protein
MPPKLQLATIMGNNNKRGASVSSSSKSPPTPSALSPVVDNGHDRSATRPSRLSPGRQVDLFVVHAILNDRNTLVVVLRQKEPPKGVVALMVGLLQ